MTSYQMEAERQERLKSVNELIILIASCGRKFFRYKNNIARFEKSGERQKIWYIDRYTQKKVYPYPQAVGNPNFCEGHTLWCLVMDLRKYIMDGIQLVNLNSDYWGYHNEDIKKIYDKAYSLGIVTENAKEKKVCFI